MNGKQSLVELALSKGFKIADPNDPIYKEGSIISVNPSLEMLEKQSEQPDDSQSSPLNLMNLSVDPASAVASLYGLNNQQPSPSMPSTTENNE
jgi:hypothetical protein